MNVSDDFQDTLILINRPRDSVNQANDPLKGSSPQQELHIELLIESIHFLHDLTLIIDELTFSYLYQSKSKIGSRKDPVIKLEETGKINFENQ